MKNVAKIAENGADRRAYPRSPVVVREARLICGIEVFFGYAQNISRSGLFISTTKQRKVGDAYKIQFTLPGDENVKQFECNAEVVWFRPYKHGSPYPSGFGLRFTDLNEEDGDYIDNWVEKVCKTNPKEKD